MKILAITQARIGSTRLPEKILKKVNKQTLLEIHLKRILESKRITKLKIATTTEPDVEKILAIAANLGIEVYQGSTNNVLERFYKAAEPENPGWVVRLTSDCPLIDPIEIDKVINYAILKDVDYVSNTLKPTFPDGIDVEVFKYSALERAYKNATLNSEREHVTPYIWKNSSYSGGNIFSSDCVINDIDYSDIRLTVDTIQDFEVIRKLIEIAGINKRWLDYVNILNKNLEIKKINKQFERNEGYAKSIEKDECNG